MAKLCWLKAVALIFLLTSPPLSTAQIKKFVYSGPDGCTTEECECTENVVKTTNEQGTTIITSSWSCDKSSPTDYIRIPSSILQIFENVYLSLSDAVSGIPERTRSFAQTVNNSGARVANGLKSFWNGGFEKNFPKTTESLKNLGDSIMSAVIASWITLNMLTDYIFNETEMAFESLKRYVSNQ